MKRSESIIEITKALIAFHKEIDIIYKTETNPFFKSKYASLPDILKAIKEPLLKNNIVLMQFPVGAYELETVLLHNSGEWLAETYAMRPAKDDPQGEGSRITYQRRYALGAVLSLNVDVDDDANACSKISANTANEEDKPWFSDDNLKATLEATKGGNYSAWGSKEKMMEHIFSKYKVNKKHRETLMEAK